LIARGDGSPQARAALADEIARLTADYVMHQLQTRRDQLIAEQAFRQEALLNPRLAELVLAHQDILLQGGRQMLEVLGSREPSQDAQVLTAIIGRMEYQGLLASAPADADCEMLGILTRFMQWVLS
ncbi:MAG: TetR family transcriptional regulator, partial [Oxalobacteraceae bacterium]